MKSWFDLNNDEQLKLKEEFNSKSKIIDLRIILYGLAIISAFPIIIAVISMTQDYCYENGCTRILFIFGVLFIVFLCSALINSLLLSEKENEFKEWLKLKKIVK